MLFQPFFSLVKDFMLDLLPFVKLATHQGRVQTLMLTLVAILTWKKRVQNLADR